MRNDYTTKPMTQEEVKEALKLFNQCIKKSVITYEHADPIKENCYISSGDIEGIYFPNSEIKMINENYEFVSVSKYGYQFSDYNNNLGVIYYYQSKMLGKEDYYFISFNDLLYTRMEQEIREQAQKQIARAKAELKTLNAIKFITKKDGGNYEDLLKNIDKSNGIKCWWYEKNNFNNWIKVYFGDNTGHGATITLYKGDSVESIKAEIKQTIYFKEKYIKECETSIKKASKTQKIVNQINELIKKLEPSYSDFEIIKKYIERK